MAKKMIKIFLYGVMEQNDDCIKNRTSLSQLNSAFDITNQKII